MRARIAGCGGPGGTYGLEKGGEGGVSTQRGAFSHGYDVILPQAPKGEGSVSWVSDPECCMQAVVSLSESWFMGRGVQVDVLAAGVPFVVVPCQQSLRGLSTTIVGVQYM